MLLDADGASVRWRPHEHVVDRWAGAPVLIEKLFRFGRRVSQIAGVALIGWGFFVLVH
jgi:hypothetical protein